MSTKVDQKDLLAEGIALIAELGDDPIAQATRSLQWAEEKFGSELVVASSMGDEVLVHLAEREIPGVDLLFIDTGYHFSETLELRDQITKNGKLRVRTALPLLTIDQQTEKHGRDLWFTNPDACCAIRKVEPLERNLTSYSAWVTGMRRVDAPTRVDIDVITWDARRDKIKINPLATWSDEFLQTFIVENSIQLNKLRARSFTSIGCEPCTRATAPGEDPRAGRWSGTSKTECGLHT
ncbi:MAG: phosphoadenylyl-sulfate reductase [Actinomycetota bacterium]